MTLAPESQPSPAADAEPFHLELLDRLPEAGPPAEEWDEAVGRLGGSVYMTSTWLRTWWAHYGGNDTLVIFTARAKGAVVGIVPLYVARLRVGVIRVKVARLVGANIPPKAFEVPLHPDWSGRVVAEVIRRLFATHGVDLLSFGPLSDGAPGISGVREAMMSGEFRTRVREEGHDVVTVFAVPSSVDEYLDALGSSERQFRRKKVRQLTRDFSVTTDVVSEPSAVAAEFERFWAHHAVQWQRQGRGGHFLAWPGALDFHRSLVRCGGPPWQVLFFRLLVNGSVVANRYVYQFGSRLYPELTSREVGPDWDRRGLGTVSSHHFFEAAIAMGASEINSGLGSYGHKARGGGREVPVRVWRVTGRGAWRRLRVRAFLAVSRGVRLGVHRVWYRRILPRLPAAVPRNQPRFLVRLDC